MEKSALVYIILTAVTVAFGFLVKNRDYTTEYLSGRRIPEIFYCTVILMCRNALFMRQSSISAAIIF